MKINVLGLLVFLIVQVFSGCSAKMPTVETRNYCDGLEYPERVSSSTPICFNIRDIDEKAECASKQFVTLNSDYDKLLDYVRNCR